MELKDDMDRHESTCGVTPVMVATPHRWLKPEPGTATVHATMEGDAKESQTLQTVQGHIYIVEPPDGGDSQ